MKKLLFLLLTLSLSITSSACILENLPGIKEEGVVVEEEGEHKHFYCIETTTPSTCVEEGKKTFTCKCGESYSQKIAKSKHIAGEPIIVNSIYGKKGLRTIRCKVCKKDIYVEDIPTDAHNLVDVEMVKATCTKCGYTTAKCSVCGEVVTYNETPSTDIHSFGEWVVTKTPTPEKEGEKERKCECGETEKRMFKFSLVAKNSLVIPSAGINAKVVVADFTQDAVDNNDIVCNFTFLDYDRPIVLGHNYGTLKDLWKTKVGEPIYLYIDGKYTKYIVDISEKASIINNGADFKGVSGIKFISDDFGNVLRLYTCHGEDRWIVMAKPS